MVLSSLRISMDRRITFSRNKSVDLNSAAEAAGSIEKMRFKFFAESGRTIGSEVDINSFYIATENLLIGLVDLNRNEGFRAVSSGMAFQFNGPMREQNSSAIINLEPGFGQRITVYEASVLLQNTCGSILKTDPKNLLIEIEPPRLDLGESGPSTKEAIRDLKSIVPAQKIAPVKFVINNNIISIEDYTSSSRYTDKKNIADAKAEIINNGKKIVEHLKKSNCDRRLIENIESLHKHIDADSNAVQLGISNISFGVMAGVFIKELPDAVNAMLHSHNMSINMYIAQFPDWVKFSENASSAELTLEDVEKVRDSSDFIASFIENNEGIAEPKVLKAFRRIGDLARNPSASSKRAVFAVIRTIENLISKILEYTIEYFEQTIRTTIKATAKATSIVLLTLAINGSAELISLSPKMNELSWLKNAITIVRKQLKNLD